MQIKCLTASSVESYTASIAAAAIGYYSLFGNWVILEGNLSCTMVIYANIKTRNGGFGLYRIWKDIINSDRQNSAEHATNFVNRLQPQPSLSATPLWSCMLALPPTQVLPCIADIRINGKSEINRLLRGVSWAHFGTQTAVSSLAENGFQKMAWLIWNKNGPKPLNCPSARWKAGGIRLSLRCWRS